MTLILLLIRREFISVRMIRKVIPFCEILFNNVKLPDIDLFFSLSVGMIAEITIVYSSGMFVKIWD